MKRFAALSAVVTVLAVAVESVPLLGLDSGGPGWVPSFATAGVGQQLYVEAVTAVGPLVLLALALGLGYRAERTRNVGARYREFAAAVGAGSVLALVAAVAVLTAVGSGGGDPVMLALALASVVATVSLVVVAGALAGVTLGRSRGDGASLDRSVDRLSTVAVGAGVAAVLAVALNTVVDVLLAVSDGVGLPAWLPAFGTAGADLVIYSYAFETASALALVGLAVGAGYAAGRRRSSVDVTHRFVAVVAVAAVAGVVIGSLPAVWVGMANQSGPEAVVVAASLLRRCLVVGTQVTVAVVAGLGAAAFERERPGRRRSHRADGSVTEPSVGE